MAVTSLPNSTSRSSQGDAGVLDRVVQQGGRDRHVVEPQVGHDPRHREGMLDVRLPGPPVLTAVGLG